MKRFRITALVIGAELVGSLNFPLVCPAGNPGSMTGGSDMNDLSIRRAAPGELDAVWALVGRAVADMNRRGNPRPPRP